MLVYYFTDIELPFERAEDALLRTLETLDRSASAAYREGERLAIQVGSALPIARAIRITAGEPSRHPAHTVVPLTWEAAGATALFPRMEADLLLTPMGADYSHLSFRGSYDPPFGAFGDVVDKMVMHRVAEGTVRRFTERLAASLVETEHAQPLRTHG